MGTTQNYPCLGTIITMGGVPVTSLTMATTLDMQELVSGTALVSPAKLKEALQFIPIPNIQNFVHNALGTATVVGAPAGFTITVTGDITSHIADGSLMITNIGTELHVVSSLFGGVDTVITFYEDCSALTPTTIDYGKQISFIVANAKLLTNGFVASLLTDTAEVANLVKCVATSETTLVLYYDYPPSAGYILTVATKNELSSLTDILSFAIPLQSSPTVIDTIGHTITFDMPYGTDFASLIPTITLSHGARISPLSGVHNDFNTPVVYVVTAQDTVTTENWTVTVSESLNSAAEILTCSTAGQVGTSIINSISGSVQLNVANGTVINPTSLIGTLSTGATVSPLFSSSQVFTSGDPNLYAVTAEDTVTQKNWSVTITVLP